MTRDSAITLTVYACLVLALYLSGSRRAKRSLAVWTAIAVFAIGAIVALLLLLDEVIR